MLAESSSDDDDEGLSSDEEELRQPVKRRRRQEPGMSLFEDEAAEGDSDEEEELAERVVQKEQTAAELNMTQRLEERLARQRAFKEKSVEDIAAEIEKRHKQSRTLEAYDDAGDIVLSREANLPTVTDPKLFCIKCKPGEERKLMVRLMNRFVDMAASGKPMQTFSCVSPETKGFIYIEARNEAHVSAALRGMRGVFRFKVTLVPITEMTTVMTLTGSKQHLKAGSYVRLRRDPYKNDLARVFNVLESGTKVCVQVVPRFDYSAPVVGEDGQFVRPKKKNQPPQGFFDLERATAAGLDPRRERYPHTGEYIDRCMNRWFKDGFELKELNIRMVGTKNVNPTLDELQRFRRGRARRDSDDEEEGASALKDGEELDRIADITLPKDAAGAGGGSLAKGDTVRVVEGELQHLTGKVISVDTASDTVRISSLHEDILGQELTFNASELMKYFKVGDHVKVTGGRYAGETGTVVHVDEGGDDWVAIIFTDSGAKEIQVFVRDLKESAEVSVGLDSLGGFKLYDLVMLSQAQHAIIVHIGTGDLRVMTQTGTSKSVRLAEIRKKCNLASERSSALDNSHNTIQSNDVVKVVNGANKGREGTIKHMFRSILFLHSRMITENSGVFVDRARNVTLSGSKVRAPISGLGARGGGRAGRGGRGGGGPRGRRGEEELVGKSVKIKGKGRFKGYIGIIVNVHDDTVRVELHGKNKSINFSREKVEVIGNVNGRMDGVSTGLQAAATPVVGGQTPMHATATPMHQPTPLADNPGTPLHAPGTPSMDAWDPSSTGPGAANSAWDPSSELSARKSGLAASATGAQMKYGVDYGRRNAAIPPTPSGYASGGRTPGEATPSDYGSMFGTPSTPITPHTPSHHLAASTYQGVATMPETSARRGDRPVRNDKVRVITGEQMGATGTLIGLDDQDAIVKMDVTLEIKILLMSCLEKVA